MKENFAFIWMYTLQIVKWYFENGFEDKALKTFNDGATLVVDGLKGDAYPMAVRTLTKEQMDKIWDYDSKLNEERENGLDG